MHVETPQSCCEFGIARVDITPPVGMYHRMWGAATHDCSEGVHRPLTATAIVFRAAPDAPGLAGDADRDQTLQVLIAVDHCLLASEQVVAIQQSAATLAGIDPTSIAITFSHTHAAGLLNSDREHLPGGELLGDYFESMTVAIADVVNEAVQSVEPAHVTYALGRCALAAHRDLFDDESQQWVCGYNPKGSVDDSVVVARVTNTAGQLLATCVHYACHPTTLAWDNRLVSPDFPGVMRETVEAHTSAPCVFLQGASGDVGPVRGFVGETATADQNGRELAFSALSALESMPAPATTFVYTGAVESGAVIGTWADQPLNATREQQVKRWQVARPIIPMPYREDRLTQDELVGERDSLIAQEEAARQANDEQLAADTRALVERETRKIARLKNLPDGDSYPYQAVLWRVGDAVWIAIQGEPYNVLQRELRSRFPDTMLVISTIANGWGPSYMPPQDTYGQGVYQESIAVLAPGSLESLIESLTTTIRELS